MLQNFSDEPYGGIVGCRALPAGPSGVPPALPFGWRTGESYEAGILTATNPFSSDSRIRSNTTISVAHVRDGVSNTMMVAEDTGRTTSQNGRWAYGLQSFAHHGARINANRLNEIFSDHPGGAQILLGDGAVRFLKEGVDRTIIDALATRKRGEVIPGNTF